MELNMIIDCFTFFNELDILEGRLEYLYDTVDYFVIVEANITHRGIKKPLNYLENIERYKKYSDKILYFPFSMDVTQYNLDVKLTQCDFNSPHWCIENAQRNHIKSVLKLFGPDVIVMVSDADEIPNKDLIKLAIDNLHPDQPALTMGQDMFYYNFKQKQVAPWAGTVITTNKIAMQVTPQNLRDNRWSLPGIHNAGWHLSYWGTPEDIKYKIESFAHQELNNINFTDIEKIKERISVGADLFDRSESARLIPVDENTINSLLLGIFSKYLKN